MRGLLVLLLATTIFSIVFAQIPRCTSPIYCQGPFLATLQQISVANDSKHFVDRPLKAPVPDVLFAFSQLPSNASQSTYRAFVDLWMHPAGYEVQAVTPVDWVEQPGFVNQLPQNLQPFALSLQSKWKSLVRIFNETGLCAGCYSSIPVPNPFVVAGGRFVEYYYWDSYWALQGLIVSEMLTTAQHVVDNLLYVVDEIGFIPNGGRIYYLSRSQPPMLTLMVQMLYAKTRDTMWLKRALQTLETEYKWWTDNRVVRVIGANGQAYNLNRYRADTVTPRPESYKEDVLTCSILPAKERPRCYTELASGAETGWDFSSRWLRDFSQLSTIHTSDVIPVDLNSILYQSEKALAEMYFELGNVSRAQFFQQSAELRRIAIHQVFWNDLTQNWGDHIIAARPTETPFYISNLMPIWSSAFHQSKTEAFKIIQRLWPQMFFPGGVPVSFINSDQQWDFPNAWAPLQQFIIEALDGLQMPAATALADQLSVAWFNSNYCAWKASSDDGGLFFEKYDVTKPGIAGGGGEYQVQSGFGWTNGVLLKLLQTRAHLFSIPQCS